MSTLQIDFPTFAPTSTVVPKAESQSARPSNKATSLMKCLIVTADVERAEKFRHAAEEQGWEPLICPHAESARDLAGQFRFRLVMVDIASFESTESVKELAEDFAVETQRLLMIIGTDGDVMEEIWARGMGAWTYLPGVDDESDIAMLCGEARGVAGKLSSPVPALSHS